MPRVIAWIGEWVAISAVAIGAVLAAGDVLPETPTSILLAFISVSMSALALLGWVLREQIATNRRHADELIQVRVLLARICDRLRVPSEVEKENKNE